MANIGKNTPLGTQPKESKNLKILFWPAIILLVIMSILLAYLYVLDNSLDEEELQLIQNHKSERIYPCPS